MMFQLLHSLNCLLLPDLLHLPLSYLRRLSSANSTTAVSHNLHLYLFAHSNSAYSKELAVCHCSAASVKTAFKFFYSTISLVKVSLQMNPIQAAINDHHEDYCHYPLLSHSELSHCTAIPIQRA